MLSRFTLRQNVPPFVDRFEEKNVYVKSAHLSMQAKNKSAKMAIKVLLSYNILYKRDNYI